MHLDIKMHEQQNNIDYCNAVTHQGVYLLAYMIYTHYCRQLFSFRRRIVFITLTIPVRVLQIQLVNKQNLRNHTNKN